MTFVPMKDLQTQRLLLRRISMEDIYDYYENIASDGDVMRYLLKNPHQDIGETLEEIQGDLDAYEGGRHYRWAVERKEDHALLGVCELTGLDEAENSANLTCFFARAYWGQGYATETVRTVAAFAFGELGVEKLTAEHLSGNEAAGGVLRKVGMRHVGTVPGKYEKCGLVFDAEVYELVSKDREPLTVKEYQKLAMATLNPELGKKDVLINGVMGLCGEAGEAIDIVKKHLAQGHPLDRDGLIKELGDVAWYLAETACALDVSLEEVFRENLEKLRSRYPQGFSREKSMNRE